jgi:transposase-like protein
MRQRRRITEEFKQRAVELVKQFDVTKRKNADALGIEAKMLGKLVPRAVEPRRQGVPRRRQGTGRGSRSAPA